MRVAALTYTFGTPKTELGLYALARHGYTPELIIAAPPVELTFYKSKIRTAPQHIPTEPPKQLAWHYKARYVEAPHNSGEACAAMRAHKIDVAVILGARILKAPIIQSARIGILNLHPGILPINRGLDNVKWAVLLDMPQGATAHLIDTRVDSGRIVAVKEVPVYPDDTLMDIQIRIQAEERHLMIRALDDFYNHPDYRGIISIHPPGEYRHSVPPELELTLEDAFWRYKTRLSPAPLMPERRLHQAAQRGTT